MTQRYDGWILTQSGIKFDLFAPTPDMVNINDIAHALAHICRFGGHSQEFYSVAQHSLIVSAGVSAADAMVGLMHDATEAYCGDMVRPLKRRMPDYKMVEDGIWLAIQAKFRLGDITPAIKVADERALQTERRDLMIPSPHLWDGDKQRALPFEGVIFPRTSHMAKQAFLQRFHELENFISAPLARVQQ
jgi:hypothetical protein